VTRLGELSPIKEFFTLGIFSITEVAPNFGHIFPRSKSCINFNKKIGCAIVWAIKNSSGHPGGKVHWVTGRVTGDEVSYAHTLNSVSV
jgi:hypothetical protein